MIARTYPAQEHDNRADASSWALVVLWVAWLLAPGCPVAAQVTAPAEALRKAIQAGSATVAPVDSPTMRIDPNVVDSPFAGVGSLSIYSGGNSYVGTAVAISRWYVLTAGHNLDVNDDGVVDPGISIGFSLNAGGSPSSISTAVDFVLCPEFSGFLHPTITRDLGLLRLSQALPAGAPVYAIWSEPLAAGQAFTVVGYGQSGSGSSGYSTGASLSTKRVGGNIIDSFTADGGVNVLYHYDFDAPTTVGSSGGSLGNDWETLIGYGDSGSPLFIENAGEYYVAGINTFTQGSGYGLFGDEGGGIPLYPYLDWIEDTADVTAVPEPSAIGFAIAGVIAWAWRVYSRRWRSAKTDRPQSTRTAVNQLGKGANRRVPAAAQAAPLRRFIASTVRPPVWAAKASRSSSEEKHHECKVLLQSQRDGDRSECDGQRRRADEARVFAL